MIDGFCKRKRRPYHWMQVKYIVSKSFEMHVKPVHCLVSTPYTEFFLAISKHVHPMYYYPINKWRCRWFECIYWINTNVILSSINRTFWYGLLHRFQKMKCIIKRVKSRRNIKFLSSDGCFTIIFCFTRSYFTISSCVAIHRYPFVNTQHNFMLKIHLLIQKRHLNGVTFCLFTCALHIQTKRCRCGYPTVFLFVVKIYATTPKLH